MCLRPLLLHMGKQEGMVVKRGKRDNLKKIVRCLEGPMML